MLDRIAFKAGSFYVVDRGCIDFARLHTLHRAQAFFVIRAKSNLQYRRLYSHLIDKTSSLCCDQTILLTGVRSCTDYPVVLRRIKFYDATHDKLLVFLTNHFDLPALTITELYRCRWQVELYFKWIYQHLRTILIDGAPQIFPSSTNRDKDLVGWTTSPNPLCRILCGLA